MQFFPGANSPIDVDAGGWATYSESIPALYGNYVFESKKFESEIGLRMEYVDLNYEVNPDHPTYSSDGYDYLKPFPTIRIAYKLNDYQKISLFYNRRVDRPNEVDIRIFPKYDDAELIKVGNPALRPQFTNTVELAYKKIWENGSFYSSIFHRRAEGTITRIASSIPGSNLLYAIFQNAGKSYNTGLELILSQQLSSLATINANITTFRNQIDAFTVSNLYPEPNTFSAPLEKITSYSVKLNSLLKPSVNTTAQISFVYLGPDLIPQGRIDKRYSLDIGIRQKIQKGKGELFLNATDILNTMVITKDIKGQAFSYISNDYYETQVVRIGYSMKF
jgi:outer membrane receptor protein involved in Fe transport